MSRISTKFAQLQQQQSKALIPFVTAGDPNGQATVPILHDLVKAGADILELGIPFSDPAAEGPVIQAACERALQQGMTLGKVFALVQQFREQDAKTPLVLMGYLNPIEIMGYKAFAKAAQQAGVDGLIVVDLPVEEAAELAACLGEVAIDLIYLIAPTTTTQRIEKIAQIASGFLYYVSFKGVTGANRLDVSAVESKVNAIKQFANLPVCVGFGIRDAATCAQVATIADGAVVGSALVQRMAEAEKLEIGQKQAVDLLREMRTALDG